MNINQLDSKNNNDSELVDDFIANILLNSDCFRIKHINEKLLEKSQGYKKIEITMFNH